VANIKKIYQADSGILSIMYHRFDENKYPSTNIRMEVFKEQITLIKKNNIEFINPIEFDQNFNVPKKEKKILITIDDGFTSFYENAWPFLKKNKIPFLLFISTKQIGKNGYMNWEQIKEVEKENFAFIGNHSYSHDYLTKYNYNDFIIDINKSIKDFKVNLNYNPIYFSYPFGEYSLEQKKFIEKNFKYGFGQHSGVIDINKDKYELPRFPINEKYGDLERFKFLIKLKPLQYKSLTPEQKLIKVNNPPNIYVEFFKDQININNINCFSNEGGNWKNSEIEVKNNILNIKLKDKFTPRRGRVNCSLKDNSDWRWFGTQFTIEN